MIVTVLHLAWFLRHWLQSQSRIPSENKHINKRHLPKRLSRRANWTGQAIGVNDWQTRSGPQQKHSSHNWCSLKTAHYCRKDCRFNRIGVRWNFAVFVHHKRSALMSSSGFLVCFQTTSSFNHHQRHLLKLDTRGSVRLARNVLDIQDVQHFFQRSTWEVIKSWLKYRPWPYQPAIPDKKIRKR